MKRKTQLVAHKEFPPASLIVPVCSSTISARRRNASGDLELMSASRWSPMEPVPSKSEHVYVFKPEQYLRDGGEKTCRLWFRVAMKTLVATASRLIHAR